MSRGPWAAVLRLVLHLMWEVNYGEHGMWFMTKMRSIVVLYSVIPVIVESVEVILPCWSERLDGKTVLYHCWTLHQRLQWRENNQLWPIAMKWLSRFFCDNISTTPLITLNKVTLKGLWQCINHQGKLLPNLHIFRGGGVIWIWPLYPLFCLFWKSYSCVRLDLRN
jgi:hypothetical protein